MKPAILDASALIALIRKEPGFEIVRDHLSAGRITSVNLSEAAASLEQRGMDLGVIRDIFASLMLQVVVFDEQLAYVAAGLRKPTFAHGLGIGDRACLAAGLRYNLPVLTADQNWRDIDVGVEICLLRERTTR